MIACRTSELGYSVYECPIEMVLEFEEEDMFNGLPISTSPACTVCPKCKFNKGGPIDYKSKRGCYHKYTKYYK